MREVLFDSAEVYQKVPKGSTSLVEILAVLILGGIGMAIALLGLYLDNPILYISGLIIVIATALIAVTKAGNAIYDFMNRFKRKDK